MGENSKSVAPRFEECERKACGERQRLSFDRGKPSCTVPLTLFRPKCGRFRFRAQRQRTPTRSRRTRVGAKSYNRPRISYGVANRLAHSAFSVPFRFFRSKNTTKDERPLSQVGRFRSLPLISASSVVKTQQETILPLKTPKNRFGSCKFSVEGSSCVVFYYGNRGRERKERNESV